MSVALFSLWSPILLSAMGVFLAGNLVWIVMQHHNSDWKKLPDEETVRGVLKGLAPGHYSVPYVPNFKGREDASWHAKYLEGPVVMLNVFPLNPVSSIKPLAQWLTYCLVVSCFVAYVAGTALAAGAPFMKVLQLSSTVAFLAYSGSAALGSIWYGHTWIRTAKDLFDGLLYGLLTGVIFGWLWP